MFEGQCVVILSLVATVCCNIEGYIVGGELADIRKFPYCAYLSITCNTQPSAHYCGSSILNQDIVLTAAHCLYNYCGQDLIINLSSGSSHRKRGYITRGITYFIHELYREITLDHDIALVRIRNKVQFSNRASRVALMRNPPPVDQSEVAGWGIVDKDKMTQIEQLKHLKQIVWKRTACEQLIGTRSAGKLCASFDKNQFPDVGDSGSALVVNGYIQIGIVSYKKPDILNHLVIYTNVSYYVDWVQKRSKSLYCNNK